MVNVTPEEVLEMRKRREPGELGQMDKDIIGETCRLEIPFRSTARMKQTADLLRGFAAQLDFYAERHDLPQRTVLFHLAFEARVLNRKLRDTRGAGRPKKTYDGD